jgi:FMN phosphatase YigB (HAD superfamily)
MHAGERWLLVDVGQVLIAFDHGVISRRLVTECFPPERQSAELPARIEVFILDAVDGPSPNDLIDRGRKDLAWLCAHVGREFGVTIALAVFEEIWTSIFAPSVNIAVVAAIDGWARDGFHIGICSNTNAAHWEFLRRTHPEFRRVVDDARCWLSFRMGLGKGDPGFFERIAGETGSPAGHHLLVDDKVEHCLAARAAGMRAIVFDPHDIPGSLRCIR